MSLNAASVRRRVVMSRKNHTRPRYSSFSPRKLVAGEPGIRYPRVEPSKRRTTTESIAVRSEYSGFRASTIGCVFK
jgi:hypothetical protein